MPDTTEQPTGRRAAARVAPPTLSTDTPSDNRTTQGGTMTDANLPRPNKSALRAAEPTNAEILNVLNDHRKHRLSTDIHFVAAAVVDKRVVLLLSDARALDTTHAYIRSMDAEVGGLDLAVVWLASLGLPATPDRVRVRCLPSAMISPVVSLAG